MSKSVHCYIGCRVKQGEHGNGGIYACSYDEDSGRLQQLQAIASNLNIGAIFVDHEHGVLYCTDERENSMGTRAGGGGQILSFRIDDETGKLSEIDRRPSLGTMPADITCSGSHILVVNHATKNGHATITDIDERGRPYIKVLMDESNLVLFPAGSNGYIGNATDVFKATGSGPLDAQVGAHLHCIRRDPSGRLFVSCDKGADMIHMFTIREDKIVRGASLHTEAGYAPRYCIFHPTLPYFYVNCEFSPHIYALQYDMKGDMRIMQCLRLLPEHERGPEKHGQSDIAMSPDGCTLYDLYRQLDEIFVLRIHGKTGKLSLMQSVKSPARLLRSCTLSPDGDRLYVVGNESGNVLAYPIAKDGCLLEPSIAFERPNAASIVFHQD